MPTSKRSTGEVGLEEEVEVDMVVVEADMVAVVDMVGEETMMTEMGDMVVVVGMEVVVEEVVVETLNRPYVP